MIKLVLCCYVAYDARIERQYRVDMIFYSHLTRSTRTARFSTFCSFLNFFLRVGGASPAVPHRAADLGAGMAKASFCSLSGVHGEEPNKEEKATDFW